MVGRSHMGEKMEDEMIVIQTQVPVQPKPADYAQPQHGPVAYPPAPAPVAYPPAQAPVAYPPQAPPAGYPQPYPEAAGCPPPHG